MEVTMIFNQNDTLRLHCRVDNGAGEDDTVTNLFIMRVRDEIVIINDDVGTPLKFKKGTWFNRLERFKKHRTAFKEFLAKTKATKTEIIGIDLK